jgi:hypothetical protein
VEWAAWAGCTRIVHQVHKVCKVIKLESPGLLQSRGFWYNKINLNTLYMPNSPDRPSPKDFPPVFVKQFIEEGKSNLADLYSYVWSRLGGSLTPQQETLLGHALQRGDQTIIDGIRAALTTEQKGSREDAVQLLHDIVSRLDDIDSGRSRL